MSLLSDVFVRRRALAPGLLLTVLLAAVAQALGAAFPLLGGAVCGIVLGMAVATAFSVPPLLTPGIKFAGKWVLQASVVLLGLGLNLEQVARTGLASLAVTAFTLAAAFVSAWLLGRWLGVGGKLTLLIGVGTAICGGSAIAAAAPIVEPDEHELAYALSTIFLFNVIAVLLFPPLGHALGLSDRGFGLWAGTAINDTSSVAAAGYHYSRAAGDYAIVVKLTRAVLILPVSLALVAWRARQGGDAGREDGGGFHLFRLSRVFPWFILWFVVASAVASLGVLPPQWLPAVHGVAGFLITVALTGIGLAANFRKMAATGPRPLLLGLLVWVVVAVVSLLAQAAQGGL
ncbi:MAG: YeiH family protein [Burkholderiaceae bacterium]|jgi:uncharacterized integral membrane protein (TIGR00698 family)|nr:YeiH family protein [Burkholderiaceae bacterium]